MMKEKLLLPVALTLLACGVYTAPAVADIYLFDWVVNIDGVIAAPFDSDPLPPEVDDSLFDDWFGLGTVTVTVDTPGAHYVGLFVDHEIDEADNTFFNENGATFGAATAGQSWEIDEPSYVFGDIYLYNFLDSSLDNSNAVPAGWEDDVSMAMGWEFTVPGGLYAEIEFLLSDIAPPSGFYLEHNDPDSDKSVYFSSDLTVVPVPGAILMGVIGFGSVGWLGRNRAFKKFFAKK